MERDGLVKRTVTVQVPIRVDYEATPLGKAFVQQTHPLWMWCALNLSGFDRARAAFDRGAQSARAKSEVSGRIDRTINSRVLTGQGSNLLASIRATSS
ncbi:MAG TPA: winged helix-turn-helix transcriptional regulator [Acidobacteriaceae bacterium]